MEVEMKVGEVMTKGCTIVHANDTVQRAAQVMAEEDLGWLPVEDGDRLIGMITDRDIAMRCVAEGKDGDCRVRDAMTKDVKYCFEDEDLDHTLQNMAEIQIRRIPVMDRKKQLIGILSLADVALSAEPDRAGALLSSVVSPGGAHAGDEMR
jgi:CBS domain-containing protein